MQNQEYNKDTLALELVNVTSDNPSGLEFSKETMHHFVAPVFLKAMYALWDKNIPTLSCGSGKERNILPGITGDFNKLSEQNKEVAKTMMISDFEYRIGTEMNCYTTLECFEDALMDIVDKFSKQ